MQYDCHNSHGLKVMAKVNVFAQATDADAVADGRAMTLAPWIYLSQLAKHTFNVENFSVSKVKYFFIRVTSTAHSN